MTIHPNTTSATRPGLWARLRKPQPTDVVEVSFTGHAHAVTAVARALASVTVVSGMRHTVEPATVDQDEPLIRLDATCHPTRRTGGAR